MSHADAKCQWSMRIRMMPNGGDQLRKEDIPAKKSGWEGGWVKKRVTWDKKRDICARFLI